ncbi:MAG: hypothetical protein ACM3NW_09855 [Syntrophomonadaceae bacterium]
MNDVRDRRGLNLGVALLCIGAYFALQHSFHFHGPGPMLLLIGTILLVVSALRSFRGPLVAAGVLIGLGAGYLLREPLDRWMPGWATLLLGLGAGLLLVAVLDHSAGRERRPTPLVPGVILVAIALITALAGNLRFPEALYDSVWRFWPFALVAAGLLLVVRAFRARRS